MKISNLYLLSLPCQAVGLSIAIIFIYSIVNRAEAAIIFTSNVGIKNAVFSPSVGDGLADPSVAQDTKDGIKVTSPGFGLVYGDVNNDGMGILSMESFTRDFNVDPESRILLSLTVKGEFRSRNNQLVTITPNITALQNAGGDPIITYEEIIANVPNGKFNFSKSEPSVSKLIQGGLELFGSIKIQGEPGFIVEFSFPNSIDAHVSVPEPTSTLGLFSLGILGAGATIKRQVKRNHSIEKETTKIG
jgi:hypothetical protein